MDTVVAITLTREGRKLKLTINIPAGHFFQAREVDLDTRGGRVWAASAFKSLTSVVKSLQSLWRPEKPQTEQPVLDFLTMPTFRVPTWGPESGQDDEPGRWNYTTTTWKRRW